MSELDPDLLPSDDHSAHASDGLRVIQHSLPDLEFPPDPALVADGWQRRFMADPHRAQEAVRLYSDLGFEVHVAQIDPADLSEICGECRMMVCNAYVTIYTRKSLPK